MENRSFKLLLLPLCILLLSGMVAAGTLEDDTIAYYKSDVTGSFPDATNTYNGTISGATFSNGNGIINSAYSYNGVSDYISLGTDAFNSLSEGSISLWLKTDAQVSNEYIYAYGQGAHAFAFYLDNNGYPNVWLYEGGYVYNFRASITIDDDAWHHLVFTVNGSGNKLYIDGTEDTSRVFSTGSSSTTGFLSTITTTGNANNLGRDYAGGGNIDALIDEIAFLDRSASPAEVTYLYDGGLPGLPQQYPYTPDSSAAFEVTADNLFNSSSILNFSVDIDGYIYNTTNGTLITELLQNSTSLYNLSFVNNNYYNITVNNINVSSNYKFNTYQNWFNVESRELITNNTINGITYNYTQSNQTNSTQFYSDAGIVATLENNVNGSYFIQSTDITTGGIGSNDTVYVYLGSNLYNVTAETIVGSPINTFTVNVTVENTSQSYEYSTTTGELNIALLKDYNYTAVITSGVAYNPDSENFILNGTQRDISFTLKALNTVNITFLSVHDDSVVTGVNISANFITDDGTLYNFSTETGTMYESLLAPYTYIISYNAEGYSQGSYTFTLVN